jgi:hypothetical protein
LVLLFGVTTNGGGASLDLGLLDPLGISESYLYIGLEILPFLLSTIKTPKHQTKNMCRHGRNAVVATHGCTFDLSNIFNVAVMIRREY